MSPRRALVGLLALGLALVARRVPWSDAPAARAQRAAISRKGVLGGADYLIAVPADWSGGLVVFAHGMWAGAAAPSPIGLHILAEGHAWAASGYRARECQPQLFIEDPGSRCPLSRCTGPATPGSR